MSVDNTILIPICERETIRGPTGEDTRFYSAEGTWQLGASLVGARIALQCSHIEDKTQIVAGMDWSVDGRNWKSARDTSDNTERNLLFVKDDPRTPHDVGNYMSVEYRTDVGEASNFGPYTRFWVAVVDYDAGTGTAPTELSAMITAVVIGRTV